MYAIDTLCLVSKLHNYSVYGGKLKVSDIKHFLKKSYDKNLENSLYAMVFLGIGEIFGSIFNGAIIDKFGGNYPVLINIESFLILIVKNYEWEE